MPSSERPRRRQKIRPQTTTTMDAAATAPLETLLPTLVAEWRETRAARLADLIERLGRQIDDELGRLLATIGKASSNRLALKAVAKLDAHADDPRMTVAIVRWITAARWPGSGALPVWQRLLARLVRLRDTRAIAPLRRAVATPPRFVGVAHTRAMASLIAATAEELAAAAAPVEDDGATWAVIEARLTAPATDFFAHRAAAGESVQAVVAPVWEAPDDATVRQVVADTLLERGEPWGELIALSMQPVASKEGEARIQLLLNKHAHLVCGAIAKIAKVNRRVFEAGFLVECAVNASMVPRRDWEAALSAPQWAMVRAVRIDLANAPAWWIAAFAAGPASQRVRRVELWQYNTPLMKLTRETLAGPWRVERRRAHARAERACRAFVPAADPSSPTAKRKA
jgi:uncharacterized protein (TIGR02996 family)